MQVNITLLFILSFHLVIAQPPINLNFSTCIGGSGYDQARDVTTDHDGNVYVTGGTSSANFPVTTGAQLNTKGGKVMDAFIMKYSSSGELIWSTLLGGDGYDRAYAIETDEVGNVYIAGRAGKNLPVTKDAFQSSFNGDLNPNPLYGEQDGFVAKFSTKGELAWCSYFGGPDRGFIRDIALDKLGNIYIVQTETSGENPHISANAFQKKNNGGYDAVIAKISNDGKQVIGATYLGGTVDDFFGPSIKVNSKEEVIVIGTVYSKDIHTSTTCLDSTLNGESDIFLAILDENLEKLNASTYLGGSGMEGTETHNLALDNCDNIIIAATTSSADFPVTADVYQVKYGGTGGAGLGQWTNYPFDAFVTKLCPHGNRIIASTYVGGKNGEAAEGVETDHLGNIYFTGATFSNDIFSNGQNSFQTKNNGQGDAFIAQLDPSLRTVNYFSYFGSTEPDYGRTLHVHSTSHVYIAGETSSESFPTTKSAFAKGGLDGFLVSFTLNIQHSDSIPCPIHVDVCK